MASELLDALLRANLAASLAILVVLGLRGAALRLGGPQSVYRLWLLPPLAFAASLLPRPAAELAESPNLLAASASGALSALWAAGFMAALVLVAVSHLRFLRRAAAGLAGPGMVGVVCPRLVTPHDYVERFTPEERDLIRAHERRHLERGDPQVNALLVLAACVNWFNPLVHLAVRCARVDQELACDSEVMARRPGRRRAYAAAMLKAGSGEAAPLLGCPWTARGPHPLELRLRSLFAVRPPERRQGAVAVAITGLAIATATAAWAAQPLGPPRILSNPAPPATALFVRISPVQGAVELARAPRS